ncbi:MAG: hypothetical protein M1829_000525 [Trizodia sp. TS-e1964]|nr:MAG: hypothetical protein M1829_000525 [Trizodia sp. TS-e1964]
MASVQSTTLPPMQASGLTIPVGLTQQGLQDLLNKYKQMRAQGVRDDDPELIKAHQILTAIQQKQQMNKQRQLFQARLQQQQQQHQAQLQQQNVASTHINGANGHSVSQAPTSSSSPSIQTLTATSTLPPPPQSNRAPASAPAPASVATSPTSSAQGFAPDSLSQKSASASGFPLSGDQLALLKSQIQAFKILSKNALLPTNLQSALFPSLQSKRSSTAHEVPPLAHTIESASQGQNGVVNGASQVFEAPSRRNHYDTFTSPYSHLQKSIGYGDHSVRKWRPMIPSLTPQGVDVAAVREERERIAYTRMLARKAELEGIRADMDVWDPTKPDGQQDGHALKLRAAIEYKMLCLLPKQRALRQQISRDMIQYDNLAMTANRAAYRRMKKQSLREARITEKLEKQQRDANESKKKKKHNDYLLSVLNHGREIQIAASNQQARYQKLGRLMMVHHQHIEKEEIKRVERTAKQRLQALKANDEEAYLKLLDQAKDTRITHLLKQTDGFLNQLAASVKQQQRSAAERYGDSEYYDDELDDDDDDDEEIDSRKVDYYAVAHRIKEEVHKQSSLLVGGTLKDYQVKGLQWMISLYNNNLNGILADEMGLGKTIQTISLITYLIGEKRQNGPFLVIVPLSTLTNWNLEFEKWAPSVARVVYKGPPAARKQQQQQLRYGHFQVLLTTYEYIIKDRPVLSKIKWIHMIVDEGHRMKNAQSKLSNTLTQYYNTRFRLILTGTPLQNNLPELWALLNFVLPTIFKSVKSFDEWFNTPFANTGGQDKMELTEEEQLLVIKRLHKVLRPFLLRRLKKDVEKDLPEKQETVIKCKFSALQARLYKQMVSHNKLFVSDKKGGKTGVRGLSNMLMQLRKLCNHPFVFDEVEDQMNPSRAIDDSIWRSAGKFELLDRILPKLKVSGHRVLMFFQMTNIMNIMEDYLRYQGYQFLRLDGSTKSDDRSELLRLFNAPGSEYFIFLLSTRAGGLGLNLQTADTVIIYDSDWNPHQDLQAQDRAHRPGQKNEVRILRLITSNSVEEKILERAQFKLDMDGKVIQAGRFDNKSTNEERDEMLRIMLESVDVVGDNLEQEEQDDDDLNLIMSRSDNELELFKKMDEERDRDSSYGPKTGVPRLMAENELPDIYLNDDGPVTEEVEEIAGRGARERTQVKYDDGLTEEQWLEAVDDDNDTIEAAAARAQAKKDKRDANKEKKLRKVNGEVSPDLSRESSEAPPSKKRKAAKPKPEKRKAEESIHDDAPPVKRKKPARGGKAANVATDSVPPHLRAIYQRIFSAVYKSLLELEADFDDDEEGKRPIIDPFVKLPPKSHYPDYYMVIQNPISMDIIKRKINREEYASLKEFRDDIRTLCTNARTYNEDGSMLFQDANLIESECTKRLKEETEEHPELADIDEQNSSGQSTAPMSSAGTPLAPAPAAPPGKLKLTFNNYTNGGPGGTQSDDD